MTNKVAQNDATSTFTFTGTEDKPINNLRQWYSDPNMIGRHFLVYSAKAPRIKRQYTICSAMDTGIRTALLQLAKSQLEDSANNFDLGMLSNEDQKAINLTLKTYQRPKGLATRIHETTIAAQKEANGEPVQGETYYIKGPMGRGLQLQQSG